MKKQRMRILVIVTGIILFMTVSVPGVLACAQNLQEVTDDKNYKIVLVDEEVPLSSGEDEMSEGKAFALYACLTTACLGALFLYESKMEKEKRSRQIEKEAARYLRKDLITENDN